jgi:hypothetical protein
MTASEHNIEEKGVSLLLRLPSDGEQIERAAEAHNQIINKHGSVWFGVVGKTYSAENVRHIRENGEYLYIVQNTSAGTCTYKGKIADFSRSVPEAEKSWVPTYYHDAGIVSRARLWVKLSCLKRVPSEEIEKLRVVSSGKNASVLLSGMAYFGMVVRK